MADTPETPPVKRAKKESTDKQAKTKPVKASPATPVSSASTAPDAPNGAGMHGLSAQIAPLRAQVEKAAKTAADKFNSVDWKTHIDPLKEQAAKTAKSAADAAKDKTGSAMQSLAKLISETAGTVDAKLGPQYGDYARQAAQTVAGAADTLDSKDVDQLMAEARDFVRKSPAVAIGAAAVVGFVLMRLAKGSDDKA
ncbi:hypothetical protein [Sphingobium mellinum]|uniref:hypothetical protein n=1 Tax=Sphingobium mellinum TaxID=1387166 RepID=UPI0030EF85DF